MKLLLTRAVRGLSLFLILDAEEESGRLSCGGGGRMRGPVAFAVASRSTPTYMRLSR